MVTIKKYIFQLHWLLAKKQNDKIRYWQLVMNMNTPSNLKTITLTCNVVNLQNRLVYASAPSVTDAHIIIPPNQIDSEQIDLEDQVSFWTLKIGDFQYLQTIDLVNMIGTIISINFTARTSIDNDDEITNVVSWERLPRFTLENERIFTRAFVDHIQRQGDIEATDAFTDNTQDNQNNYIRAYLTSIEFIQYLNWLPLVQTIESLDQESTLENLNIYNIIDRKSFFIKYPQALTTLNLIFQPWIVQYIVNFIENLFVTKVQSPPPPPPQETASCSIQELFTDMAATLCKFSGVGAGNPGQGFNLDMRNIIAPFINIGRVKEDWIMKFFNVLFNGDLSAVTLEFADKLTRFRDVNIDPLFVSDMIVFMFGSVSNATKEQTVSTICENGRKRKKILFNTIDTQLVNNKMPTFYISKIKTNVLDPVFLIAQRQLTQSCCSTRLQTPEERFRVLNLLYKDDEKSHIFDIVMGRRQASIRDNNRAFTDPYESSKCPIVSKEISRISLRESDFLAKLKYNSLIKYPSVLTFSPDNCSEKSLSFMKNIDSYSALFTELVNREFYNCNNIICSVRALFTNA